MGGAPLMRKKRKGSIYDKTLPLIITTFNGDITPSREASPGIAPTPDLKETSLPLKTGRGIAMDIHDKTRMRLDVKNSDVSGSVFDNVNMSGWTAHNVNMSGFRIEDANLAGLHITDANLVGATISNVRFEGMTIDGISVEDALAAYRQSKAA
jgi:Pentapeptide repeats (8 copies)